MHVHLKHKSSFECSQCSYIVTCTCKQLLCELIAVYNYTCTVIAMNVSKTARPQDGALQEECHNDISYMHVSCFWHIAIQYTIPLGTC